MEQMAVFLSFVVLSGIDAIEGQLVCHSGTRTSYNGAVQNNSYIGTTCPPGQICQNTVFYNNAGLSDVETMEFAGCYTSSGSGPTCSQLATTYNVTATYHNCTWNSCNTFACNSPLLPSGCYTPENEILVLPQCTLTDVYILEIACTVALFTGYPYSNVDRCKHEINLAMACGENEVVTCFEGNCPTVLDSLPYNLTLVYQNFTDRIPDINHINGVLETILGLDAQTQTEVIKAICLQSDSTYLQNMDGKPDPNIEAQLTFDNPVCDNTMLLDLYRAAAAELPSLVNARTHEEFCTPINNVLSMAVHAWKTRCNKAAVIELFRPYLPPEYSELFSTLESSVEIIEGYWETYVFPACVAPTPPPISTTSGTAKIKQEMLHSLFVGVLTALTATAL